MKKYSSTQSLKRHTKSFHFQEALFFRFGSNRGQSIDFFTKNFNVKKITGFEPNKKLFNSLIKKYEAHFKILKY